MTQEIEYRTASTMEMEVRHAERVIDLISVPYNEKAEVFLARQQKWVTEQFAPGAFTGVTGNVTVNRAHDFERPIGRVVKFHPSDPRGLRTEIRVAKMSEGNDILELADEGLLSASVGFTIPPGGEQWSADRRSRTVTKAKLMHVGLTGDPAYSGAQVLAVRSAGGDGELLQGVLEYTHTPTPNLDRIRLERMAEAAGLTLP